MRKAKIICTLGPASRSPEMVRALARAGMDVARLNFSHGDFQTHAGMIESIRAAALRAGKRVAILGDLPGPKMRIGEIGGGSIELRPGDPYTLTTDRIVGDAGRAAVTYAGLPQAVKPGDALFLNDGMVQLEVVRVEGADVHATAPGEPQHRRRLLEADVRPHEPAAREMPVETEMAAADLEDIVGLADPVSDERVARGIVRPVAEAHQQPVQRRNLVDGQHRRASRGSTMRDILACPAR